MGRIDAQDLRSLRPEKKRGWRKKKRKGKEIKTNKGRTTSDPRVSERMIPEM